MPRHPAIHEVYIPTLAYHCSVCDHGPLKTTRLIPATAEGDLVCRKHWDRKYWWCQNHGGHLVDAYAAWEAGNRWKEKCPGPDPKPTPTPTCQHCGEDFIPKRSDAKFCSSKCRVAAHRGARAS